MANLKYWVNKNSLARKLWFRFKNPSKWLNRPHFTQEQRQILIETHDPIRYGTLLLAFEQIISEKIEGSFAECGVYKGRLSKFIHTNFPDRQLFLFDTFQGFDQRDLKNRKDNRFNDTSEQAVINYLGDTKNIVIKKGFFPETAAGLSNEKFAFVMIDFDLYQPSLAALKIFYPLVSPGGFIFVHDYTSPESDWACRRAVTEFLGDKPEKPILIPDMWGTAVFRKM